MLKTICLALHLCSTLSGPAHIVDGDTLRIEGRSIRIAGLDAEEMNTRHGLDAWRGMVVLIRGLTITCKWNGEMSHNRYVATCYLPSGLDIAAEMIRNGLALDCARYSQGKYRSLEPAGIRNTLKQAPYC